MGKFAHVDSVEKFSNAVPSVAGFQLGQTNKEQGEPTKSHVASDTLILPVIHRPELQSGFECPEGPFYLEELFVAQGDLFGGEGVIAAREEVFAVELFLRRYLGAVHAKLAAFKFFDIAPHVRVRGDVAYGFVASLALKVLDGVHLFLDPFQQALSCGFVPFCLLRVVDHHKPSASGALTYGHLFEVQVVPELSMPPG